jgi:microcystin-dependent protein
VKAIIPGKSNGGGSKTYAAYIDHEHQGLGLSQNVTGDNNTRYVGGTTGGAPTSGSYLAGDFAIDQTGTVWIYTGTAWVNAAETAIVPSGTIAHFAGITPPAGWLLCNGQAISETSYPALFSALTLSFSGVVPTSGDTITGVSGTIVDELQYGWYLSGSGIPAGTYINENPSGTAFTVSAALDGSGSSETIIAAPWGFGTTAGTFNVPNFAGLAPIGLAATPVSPETLGQTVGSTSYTLNASQLPAHLHPINDSLHSHAPEAGFGNFVSTSGTEAALYASGSYQLAAAGSTNTAYTGITATLDQVGGGSPITGVQSPSACVWYIIKE